MARRPGRVAQIRQHHSEPLHLSLHHGERLRIAAGSQFENLDAVSDRNEGASDLVIQEVFVDMHGMTLAIGQKASRFGNGLRKGRAGPWIAKASHVVVEAESLDFPSNNSSIMD
jgi:hypothetical protein